MAVAAESLVFLESALSMTREGDLADCLADAYARVSMSSEIWRLAISALSSVVKLVLGSLLLAAIGGLAPVLLPIAGPVMPPTGRDASARVGLVMAAVAVARDEAAVAAAYDGAVGRLVGFPAERWGCRLGGIVARGNMATAAERLESVTATVFELMEI